MPTKRRHSRAGPLQQIRSSLSDYSTFAIRSIRRLHASAADSIRRALRPKTLGQRGEAAAARYLKRLGYIIIARGSHIRRGEIDLIAVDGRTLVFVEVKTRVSHDAGHPADAVDRDKQHRLTRLAMVYLKRHGLLETPARFDVIAITWPANKRRPTIEHYKNAFEPVGQGQMFY